MEPNSYTQLIPRYYPTLFLHMFSPKRFKLCAKTPFKMNRLHPQRQASERYQVVSRNNSVVKVQNTSAVLWDDTSGRVSIVLSIAQFVFLWKTGNPHDKLAEQKKFAFKRCSSTTDVFIVLTYTSWQEACSELKLPGQRCDDIIGIEIIEPQHTTRQICTSTEDEATRLYWSRTPSPMI